MASGRRPLIAANWKMNGLKSDGVALAQAVAAHARSVGTALPGDVLVSPPATLLDAVSTALAGSPVLLGGQDCHAQPSGAFTGDISAPMLKDLGASHVILGHSERRTLHGESDEQVAAKVAAARSAGLIAIVCVGETEAQRDSGDTLGVIVRQIDRSIPSDAAAVEIVVAYEPSARGGRRRLRKLPRSIRRFGRDLPRVSAVVIPSAFFMVAPSSQVMPLRYLPSTTSMVPWSAVPA